ncbi:MAG: ribose 5-phosphate isomerase B [Erysipelotrichaceae bacterium]|nr:ribose 5-phosphate isomerase B [Erysipelotrichaceae bacterium]MDD3924002.1 ribose 5-phosphate isomerase B [Erysipelotrichaceae bacterium]MDD4642588.1 ribose 5-phosphate isomerase B [Erysipelotrichaceae bacterium]
MKIAIGNDHVGYYLKDAVLEVLVQRGIEVIDVGSYDDQSCDYPVYGEKVGRLVANKDADLGIVLCGTGVGISIAANKVKGIRAVVCSEPYSAKLSRMHNDSNVLGMGSRVIGPELAKMIVEQWLDAEFEAGRHSRRVDLIKTIESKEE